MNDAVYTVRDVVQALDAMAPAGTAQAWDNVGVQVGDPDAPVSQVLVALDCTVAVIDEALALGAEAIVTHHPLIFKPLKNVQAGAGPSGLAFRLAQNRIALVAAHTNLDVARSGVSFALAQALGLRDLAFLAPSEDTRATLVTFVPPDHADAVREALSDAGAGQIGAYTACGFASEGTGTFRPGDAATPFTRTPTGALARETEIRLEMELPRWATRRVVAALHAAHPYEQPAYHLLDARQPDTTTGLGAIGTLEMPLGREAFLQHLCRTLGTPAVRATPFDKPVRRVAVCGGSGSDFVGVALRVGADAYVTADVTYHKFFDALGADGAARLLYVDAGHYETERHAETLLLDGLKAHLPHLEVQRTHTRTSASEMFVAEG